jgi:hypothetical protein
LGTQQCHGVLMIRASWPLEYIDGTGRISGFALWEPSPYLFSDMSASGWLPTVMGSDVY